MSEIFISEEQFIKFHHWIRIASAKEHSEFHTELTKLGQQEQFWLKQIIGHSEIINNFEIVQDTLPPSPALSNAPLPQPTPVPQETPLFAPPAYVNADNQVIQFNRNARPATASEESVSTASVYEPEEDTSSLNSGDYSTASTSVSSKSSKAVSLGSVKELLTKLATQVNLDEHHPSFQTDNYRILFNLADSNIEEEQFKNSLLLQIKKDIYQLRKSQMTSLQNVYRLAENLLRLKELFSSRNLTPFYATIKAQFGLSQRTLPIHTIFLDPVTCYKYRVEERQHNGTLTKEANPYLGDEPAIDINVPADLLKSKNPKRYNIMAGMKKRISELEALNKQLLATCSPTDKLEIIQSKLGDKRYLETDENSYLLDNGLVFQLPKKRMKGEGPNDGQEGGAATCRQECEKFKNRIWREPDALAKLVKRQSKLQDRLLEDLLH